MVVTVYVMPRHKKPTRVTPHLQTVEFEEHTQAKPHKSKKHAGRLPVRPDTNPPPTPLWTPQPILVSTWLELATWALAAPGNFF